MSTSWLLVRQNILLYECLLVLWIASSLKYLFKAFTYFFLLGCFLTDIGILYIFGILMLCELYSLQIYYSRLWFVFSLCGIFWITEIWNFRVITYFNLSLSFFLLSFDVPSFRNSSLSWDHKYIVTIYSREFKFCLSHSGFQCISNWFLCRVR